MLFFIYNFLLLLLSPAPGRENVERPCPARGPDRSGLPGGHGDRGVHLFLFAAPRGR